MAPVLIVSDVAKNSMSVARKLGVLTNELAVRLNAFRFVDVVIRSCFVDRRLSVSVLVYVAAWLAFRSSWASTYAIVAVGVSKLSVSVLVYVVAWFAFSVNAVSTCAIVYVVDLSAISANAVAMSVVLTFNSN